MAKPRCCERTKKGLRCGSPPLKAPDPDGARRCHAHSQDPVALERKAKTSAEAGARGARVGRAARAQIDAEAQAEADTAAEAAEFDLTKVPETLEDVRRFEHHVAALVAKGLVVPDAGRAVAALLKGARADFEAARGAGKGDDDEPRTQIVFSPVTSREEAAEIEQAGPLDEETYRTLVN